MKRKKCQKKGQNGKEKTSGADRKKRSLGERIDSFTCARVVRRPTKLNQYDWFGQRKNLSVFFWGGGGG